MFFRRPNTLSHSLRSRWGCKVKFCDPFATGKILGGGLSYDADVNGSSGVSYGRQSQLAHDFLESGIPAYLGWLSFAGLVEEREASDSEYRGEHFIIIIIED